MFASPCLHRRATPLLVLVLLSAAVWGNAAADGNGGRARPPESPSTLTPEAAPPGEGSWRVVVDVEHGFGLRLPPDHDIARSGTIWYVHGWHGADPLVPDLTITLAAGRSAIDLVRRDFPPSARATPVEMGPATTGSRVTAAFEHPDGTPYESVSYLVETDAGTFRIDPYETFDWPPFERVALSFHLVSFTRPWPPTSERRPPVRCLFA